MAPPEASGAELDLLRDRVAAARDRLRVMPFAGSGVPGPVDPETGEGWDRLNVLGHMSEFIPFWTRGIRRSLQTGKPFGRDAAAEEARGRAVLGGAQVGERALRLRVDRACAGLLRFLGTLDGEDLERRIPRLGRGEVRLGSALEAVLVGHIESHLEQMQVVTPA